LECQQIEVQSSNKDGYRVTRCAGFNGDGYSRPGVVVGEELTPKSQKLEIVKITTLRDWPCPRKRRRCQMKMSVGFSGALESVVTLTVGLGCWLGRELTPKSQKLEIVKITTLRHWLQKDMEMPKEDEGRVFRCAGVSGDAYSRPGSLVGEGIDTQKSKTRNCEDHHFEALAPERDGDAKRR
jgi:hypothetical protein